MSAVTVRTLRVEKIEVTPENEREVLNGEYLRRYDDRPFSEGDEVRFVRDGRQRHVDAFGPDHAGKLAIVTSLSDNGQDVKVLAITREGTFEEFWTPESCLTLAEND